LPAQPVQAKEIPMKKTSKPVNLQIVDFITIFFSY